MKKSLILAAAAIAALSACTKEVEVTPINDTKAPVFTATIEGDAETRTQLPLALPQARRKLNGSAPTRCLFNLSLTSRPPLALDDMQ